MESVERERENNGGHDSRVVEIYKKNSPFFPHLINCADKLEIL